MAKATLKSVLLFMTIICASKGQAQIRQSDYFVKDDFYDAFSMLAPGQFTIKTHDFSKISTYANLIAPETSTPDFILNIHKTTGDYQIFD
jgi:hypothetical protein